MKSSFLINENPNFLSLSCKFPFSSAQSSSNINPSICFSITYNKWLPEYCVKLMTINSVEKTCSANDAIFTNHLSPQKF